MKDEVDRRGVELERKQASSPEPEPEVYEYTDGEVTEYTNLEYFDTEEAAVPDAVPGGEEDAGQREKVLTAFRNTARKLSWITARSKDHQYIRRYDVGDRVYDRMGKSILRYGVMGSYYGTKHLYLMPGDGYKYWLMTFDLRESIILNRTEDDGRLVVGW